MRKNETFWFYKGFLAERTDFPKSLLADQNTNCDVKTLLRVPGCISGFTAFP